ncbi:cell division protein FtsH [Burkholderia ubonensis]|uniref:ATP-dependent zinc metalloprotease FtsH n=1 Tax=Burkholderia ubonensis TaxID=101571 RepID=UPI000757A559|nr:ATP-dependent zinc metalloprotease FtsH [Burkholderia ubonensis]KVD97067.1 cell division protein FtsH [Burkholderia ubonensis]
MEFKREHQINFLYVLAAMIAMLVIQSLVLQPEHIKTIPYSEFQRLASEGKVTDLVVGPTRITGAYKDAPKGAPQHFSTLRVDPPLAQLLSSENLTFSGEPEPGIWPTLLGWIMPTLGFVLVWMFLIRPMAMGRGGDGMMAIGKSKAKVYVEKDIKVTFADVAGVDEAKEELKEVVSFLKDPKSYGRLGARVPKGVLLVGPPGTGKTLLARAVAGEAGVAFFSISGSEFVEMFVGVGAARVRDLFEQARKQAPAIVFIDELDSLGRARGGVLPGGGYDEKEQTLNQLLAELDGFDTSVGIVLLAATNRPEILDPALLRAGRFDRQVLVDRPDKKGRVDILGVHLKKIKLASDVPIGDVAALTPGFSGADLANLVNEAAILATRRHADSVSLDDFTQAIERIVAGLEKRNRLLNPHEREVVAHHEMGHALVAMALPGVDPVQKISIIPRGIAALGYTIQRPTEDRFLMDRAELMNRMAVLLGGRAAERLVFDEISTGAADDLAKASEIARGMVMRYGMDPTLGQVAYEPESISPFGMPSGTDWRPRQYGEQTAAAIDTAVRELIGVAFECASSILRANRVLLERAARDLLAKETLAGGDLEAISRQVVKGDVGNSAGGKETKTASTRSSAIANA